MNTWDCFSTTRTFVDGSLGSQKARAPAFPARCGCKEENLYSQIRVVSACNPHALKEGGVCNCECACVMVLLGDGNLKLLINICG